MEPFFPLHVRVCRRCWLAQLPAFVPPEEIFDEYAYFSAYSDSWVEHARVYAEMITGRLGLGPESLVVELASNDGYLLQHFVAHGVPVLGIDPAANVATDAEARGVPTIVDFFGERLARQLVSEGRQRRPRPRQQRAGAGTRPERLRPRCRDPARLGRNRDLRVPPPRAPDRGPPVRHDLPRAFLVLLAREHPSSASRRTGSRSSTSRSSRVTAARFVSTSPTRAKDMRRPRRSPLCFDASSRRACVTPTATAASPRTSRSRSGRCSTS